MKLKTEQIIKTLQEYNDWRRAKGQWGEDAKNPENYPLNSFFDVITAREIGLTIDAAIEQLRELERLKRESLSK